MIIRDSNFDSLTDICKDFIVHHELGHIYNKDTSMVPYKSKLIMIKRALGFTPKMEFKADNFAACVLGKYNCIYALFELLRNKKVCIISKIEIIKRIIRIIISKL